VRERAIVRRIVAANPALAGARGAEVLLPPGDDMALVALGGRRALVAADQVVEGRHWAAGTPMSLVARKAVARNVSDVAAMAGIPSCTVATVALPPDLPEREIAELCDGLLRAGLEFGCPVVGGDTAAHAGRGAPMVLSVTILAEPGPTGRVVTRAGARAGDLLCVTGALGAARGFGMDGHHLRFVPRVAEALALVDALGDRLHAMIDLSDGLGSDAAHLADAAGLSVEIDGAAVPRAAGATLHEAVTLGEDYELAFAAAGPVPPHACGTAVSVVGRFADGPAGRVLLRDGDSVRDVTGLGFEHCGAGR
jgi:thiamine-monophosphate kinase